MRDLNTQELEIVSGGDLFSALGTGIINVTNAVNVAFDSPAGALFGNTLADLGLGALHNALDLTGLFISTGAYAVGNALGGKGQQTVHYYDDRAGGRYQIGFGKTPLLNGVGAQSGSKLF